MDTSAQRSTFTLLRPKSQTFNFYSCTLPPPYEVLVLLVCPCLSPTAFRPPRRERVQPCLHGPEIVAREEARLHPLFLVGRADELRTYRVYRRVVPAKLYLPTDGSPSSNFYPACPKHICLPSCLVRTHPNLFGIVRIKLDTLHSEHGTFGVCNKLRNSVLHSCVPWSFSVLGAQFR